jgi:multiple sugar transport system ATP-binding protein
MRTEIKKLHKRLGTTFIYVTHDQTEAMTMADRIVVMKDGVIQQVDTPQNLYDKPFNMFVAGFIGSPQMNFLDALVSIRNSQVYLVLSQNEINVTGIFGLDERLLSYADKYVKVGIRPEDITNDEDFVKKNADKLITAKLEVNEMMGSETYLYLDYAGEKIVARVQNTQIENDTPLLAIHTDKIHLFDPNTTVNIML